jgi:uncharacterized protein (TIGR01244 family)
MHTRKATWLSRSIGVLLAGLAVGVSGQTQGPSKLSVEGVTNLTRLDSTIACAGATKASAVPELKKMGFVAIVNLRRESEQGADTEAEKAAAQAAGLNYFHIPFTTPKEGEPAPEETIAEFLRVTADPANQPLLVHCAAGNRAAALWMIKRVINDNWTVERAKAEADLAAAPPASSVEWAVGYLKARQP